MRITCPYCGPRSLEEFTYFGDASLARPDPEGSDATVDFIRYVYVRDNPTGRHRELWYHGLGCRQWIVAERDVTTHEVVWTRAARDCALERQARRTAQAVASGSGAGRT
jgi:sarcosine oxidase subunit delta